MQRRRSTALALELAALFAVCAGALAWALADAPGIFGVDGYYHFKVAEEIAAHGPWVDVRWLPFTVLGPEGTDHHWLFHLLLAPFTAAGHDLAAVKTATIFFAALVPVTLAWVGHRFGIPHASLVALLAFTASSALPGRYLMLRTHGLSLMFMALALLALSRRRHVWLAAIAFAYMQFYHGAVILAPLGAFWLAIHAAHTKEFDSRAVLAIGAGLFLGLLLSPWFPDNVGYLIFHTVFKMGNAMKGLVGPEWYPSRWTRLLVESWPAARKAMI